MRISRLFIRIIIKFILFTIVLVFIDQLSKVYIVDRFTLYKDPIVVTPFLNIVFVLNEGVSFSMLNGFDYKLIFIVSIISLFAIIWFIIYYYEANVRLKCVILSLILSGSLGNMIDRLYYKGVVDFICVYYDKWYFPVFNLADCMISLAVILMLVNLFINKKKCKEPHA